MAEHDPWAEYRAACERTDRAFRAWRRTCDVGVVFFLGLAVILGALYVFWFRARMVMRRVTETTYASSGGPDSDGRVNGFEDYGGVRVVLDCGHQKQWDGWFPVPIPMPDDLIECEACTARAAT